MMKDKIAGPMDEFDASGDRKIRKPMLLKVARLQVKERMTID